MNIVPNDNENFRVEIQISPKDMGKITEGKKVKYRLSAFPFYEYQNFLTVKKPKYYLPQTGRQSGRTYLPYQPSHSRIKGELS